MTFTVIMLFYDDAMEMIADIDIEVYILKSNNCGY
jgi:hypothetical protein